MISALATKYYNTLFREYAICNLKHARSGKVGLRWRSEAEVLSGIGHLTCSSLRCEHHQPLPELAARFEDDPDSETPLVQVRLGEYEVPFVYEERGERKECLVKVVLCEEDGRRLVRGRRKAKEEKEARDREKESTEDGRDEASMRSLSRSRSRRESGRRSASPERRR